MALSHANVAARFARGEKSAAGSSLRCQITPTVDAEFRYLSQAISYSTLIAQRVHNLFTDQPEMWITSRYYSPTTARHKSHLERAYTEFCKNEGLPNTVYVLADSVHVHRVNPTGLASLLNNATYELWEVDRPRIRDATRRGVLSSRLHRLNHHVHNITADRDPERIAASGNLPQLLQKADEMKHHLQHWLMLPVDEMRVTVKAYLTLNEVPRLDFDKSTRPR